jgi:hypothetical protein
MGDNIENNQKRLEKATKEFLERYEQDEQRIKDIQALVIKYWDKGGDKATLKKAIEERIKANTKHTTSQKTDYKALLQLLDAQREAL